MLNQAILVSLSHTWIRMLIPSLTQMEHIYEL